MFPKLYRAPETMGAGGGDGGAVSAFIVAEGDTVQLTEGFDPTSAAFSHAGPDLMLTAPGGAQMIIADYFMQETPPTLISATGAHIDGALAVRLAGPATTGMVAGDVMPSEAIGRVSALTGEVIVIRADGTRVALQIGDAVFAGDIVESSADAGIGILLADETALSMGAEALLVLDELVYDPAAQEGSMALSVLRGVFTIVSGQVSKTDPEAMLVHTPMATIGIRGTQLGINLSGEHGMSVVLMEEADGFVGEIFVVNDGGTMTLNEAYAVLNVTAFGTAPAAVANYDRDMLLQIFGVTFAFLPIADTNGNDYGLQAAMSEGLAGLEGMAGEDLEGPDMGAEANAASDAPEEDGFVTDAGDETPVEQGAEFSFGEELAPMDTVENIAAMAVGETVVETPPPPTADSEAPILEPEPEPPVVDVTPPVAEAGSVLVAEDNIFSGQLVAHDLGEGDLVFDIVGGGLPLNGAVSISADGHFEYVPDPDYSGSDTFTYQVTDDAGNSATATVSVEVNPVADLPVLAVASVAGTEDTGVALAIAAAMSPNTTETIIAITVDGVPDGASLNMGSDNGDGSWTVTPDQLSGLTLMPPPNYSGALALTVRATSSDGGTASQDLTASISPLADQPTLTVTDVVVDVEGTPGIEVEGSRDDDVLYGGAGDDVIEGGQGDDVLYGEGGEGGGGVIPASEVALDVNAALVDVDGSETLSVEIADVPEGATLNLGADHGDGTWTVAGDDLSSLDDLKLLLPEGSSADDFALHVTATSTENETGDFSTSTGAIDVTFEGDGGSDDVLDGGKGDDALYGGVGDDVLRGGKGDDTLEGGAGDDMLEGGKGDDILEGGIGDDVLVGGKGADEFVFRAGDGHDVILDLGEQDEIRFEGPEFSVDDFTLEAGASDNATITFGDDADVSVMLNDFDVGEGYTVTQDGDAVVVTFKGDDDASG